MIEKKRNISISITIALCIFLDQISKILIRKNVEQYSDIKLIGEYFILTNVENSGAFLGMGSDFSPIMKSFFLIVLPIAILIGYPKCLKIGTFIIAPPIPIGAETNPEIKPNIVF